MSDDYYTILEDGSTGSDDSVESELEPDSFSESGDSLDSETATAPVYEITVIQDPRPFLTTDFEDYSVTEGLLLLLLLFAFISVLVRVVRRAFSWLL